MNKKKIDYIDFAKGFAIFSILCSHYCQPHAEGIWSKAIMVGGAGTHLFFIISGFGLGISSQSIKTYDFFKRRISKILIPYYLTIVLIFLINHIVPIYDDDMGVYALGGHLLLYKMFDEKIVGSFGYHFWFISTIIQFYLFFPIIVALKRKIPCNLFILISCFISISYSICITIANVADQRIFNSFFLQYLWEFNIGIILADIYREKHKEIWNQSLIRLIFLSICSFTIMGIMSIKFGLFGKTFNDIFASIGFSSLSVVVYLLMKKSILRRIVEHIGMISYELYLIHMLVYALISVSFTSIPEFTAYPFVSIIFILPVSIASAFILRIFNNKLILNFEIWTNSRR